MINEGGTLHASLLQALTCCLSEEIKYQDYWGQRLACFNTASEKTQYFFYEIMTHLDCWQSAGLLDSLGLLDYWTIEFKSEQIWEQELLQNCKGPNNIHLGNVIKQRIFKCYKQHAWFFLLLSKCIINKPVWGAETASNNSTTKQKQFTNICIFSTAEIITLAGLLR